MDQTVMRAGVHRATFTIGGDDGDGTVVAAGVGCFSIGVLKRSALVGRVYWDGMMWFRHSIEDAWSPSANEAWAWEANTGRLTPNDDEDFRDWPLANPGGEWAATGGALGGHQGASHGDHWERTEMQAKTTNSIATKDK